MKKVPDRNWKFSEWVPTKFSWIWSENFYIIDFMNNPIESIWRCIIHLYDGYDLSEAENFIL